MMPQDAGRPEPATPFPQGHHSPPIAGRIEAPAGDSRAVKPMPVAPLTPPPGLNPAPDIGSLLAALRHRWISAVLIGTPLALIVAVGVFFLLTPKHTAYAQLQVAHSIPVVIDGRNIGPNDFKTQLMTTAAQIKSRPVIQNALRRDEVRRLNLQATEIDPAGAIYDDLTVEFREGSELVTLSYSHPDPQVAVVVANGIKSAFLETVVFAQQQAKTDKVSNLEKLHDNAKDKVKTRKDALAKLLERNKFIDPKVWREERMEISTALRDSKSEYSKLSVQIIQTKAALDGMDNRIAAAKKTSSAPPKVTPATPPAETTADEKAALEEATERALNADPEYVRALSKLTSAKEEVEEYRNRGFRPDHGNFKAARQKADSAQRTLDARKAIVAAKVRIVKPATTTAAGAPTQTYNLDELYAQRDQLASQHAALLVVEKDLSANIKKLATEMAKAPTLATDYETQTAEIAREEEQVKKLNEQVQIAQIEQNAAPRITKFQDAELMKKDAKKQLLASAAAPAAVFFAVCFSLAWLEFRKRRVRNPEEISRGLGIRVVGAVPRAASLCRRVVGTAAEDDMAGTPVMESIDAIRTRLLHEADVRATRVVMITSAGPGEGKTTLAAVLASSLARAGRRTLLVDGDLRRPTVHEYFEVAAQPGFSEVLLAEIEVSEAALETPQDNLYILPAGQWDREVLHALARGGIEAIFERLSDEFDFIIVDSHPVLMATDSLLIGRQADAVILSVLREVSQMPRVYAAQQQLAGLGIRVLGAVVSGTSEEEATSAPATPAMAGV